MVKECNIDNPHSYWFSSGIGEIKNIDLLFIEVTCTFISATLIQYDRHSDSQMADRH